MAAISTAERVTAIVAELGGLTILAGTLAAFAAFVYRWYVREAIPRGLSLLVGLSAVAVYLNTTTALGQVIGGTAGPTDVQAALFNIAAFGVAAGGAAAGRRVGDRFGIDVFVERGFSNIDSDVGQLVRSVGRVTAVELPETIDDVVGYDPVPDETREDLAGKTFLFPRRLTVEQLRERLTTRLKTDYAVGHVDLELADDGSVEYLALGSRAAGIGPTLPPATNAVAIRADPAFAASAGDLVQVWETDPMQRVLTAELRGVADDTVTIAIDAADTPKIDPRKEYRLVTLPVSDRPDREFASLLRAADETFSSVTVEAGSPLHGMPVGSLDLAIVSIQPETGDSLVLPDPEQVLAPGDTVFAIARPEELRRLETAAEPLDPSLARNVGSAAVGTVGSPPAGRSEPEDGASEADPSDGAVADTTATAEPAEASDGPADDSQTEDASADDGQAEDGSSHDTDSTGIGDIPATEGARTSGENGADADEDDESIDGRADTNSFQELKEEFESGDADWADDELDDTGDEKSDDANDDRQPVEAAFGDDPSDLNPGEGESADGDATDHPGVDEDDEDTESGIGSQDDGPSFGDDDDDGPGFEDGDDSFDFEDDDNGLDFGENDDESGFEDGDDGLDFEDDDGGLDFEDDDPFDDDDGLEDLDFGDDEDDDLGALDFDEDDDDDFSFDEEDEADSEGEEDESDPEGEDEDDEEDGDGDEDEEDADEDDDDDDSGGGGASSFQQLKEEFESGDADWADDISDSPGGDMRLDE